MLSVAVHAALRADDAQEQTFVTLRRREALLPYPLCGAYRVDLLSHLPTLLPTRGSLAFVASGHDRCSSPLARAYLEGYSLGWMYIITGAARRAFAFRRALLFYTSRVLADSGVSAFALPAPAFIVLCLLLIRRSFDAG